jgi:hypothetical protein
MSTNAFLHWVILHSSSITILLNQDKGVRKPSRLAHCDLHMFMFIIYACASCFHMVAISKM